MIFTRCNRKGKNIINFLKKAQNQITKILKKRPRILLLVLTILIIFVLISMSMLHVRAKRSNATEIEKNSIINSTYDVSSVTSEEEKNTSECEVVSEVDSEISEEVSSQPVESVVQSYSDTDDDVVIVHPVAEQISSNKDTRFSIASEASSFKSFMDYRCITNKASTQYKMQQQAYTDENGLRKIGEYFCVAMGTYYGDLGDTFYVETDEGASWKVILADIKSNSHTDSTNRYTLANRCMMEFIIDTPCVPRSVKSSGTVNGLGFQGKINYIEKI